MDKTVEPIELNDDELAAVAGGVTAPSSNSVTNSFINSGNFATSNSTTTNSTVG